MRYQIISALIGLANATNNNPKTDMTDIVVLEALRSFAKAATLSNTEQVELVMTTVKQIRFEKNRVSPGCATCKTPCGNTSDYDLAGITEAEPELKELRMQTLESAAELATKMQEWTMPDEERDRIVELLYKSLSYVGWNLAADSYRELLKEYEK